MLNNNDSDNSNLTKSEESNIIQTQPCNLLCDLNNSKEIQSKEFDDNEDNSLRNSVESFSSNLTSLNLNYSSIQKIIEFSDFFYISLLKL